MLYRRKEMLHLSEVSPVEPQVFRGEGINASHRYSLAESTQDTVAYGGNGDLACSRGAAEDTQ